MCSLHKQCVQIYVPDTESGFRYETGSGFRYVIPEMKDGVQLCVPLHGDRVQVRDP